MKSYTKYVGGLVLTVCLVAYVHNSGKLAFHQHSFKTNISQYYIENYKIKSSKLYMDDIIKSFYSLQKQSEVKKTQGITGIRTKRRILMYNPVHWWKDWVNGSWETNQIFTTCPISDCIISQNRSLFNSSQVVLFKMQLLNTKPPVKIPGQIWTMVLLEPMPLVKHPNIINRYKNLINWTLSYRRESDLFVPYGQFKVNENVKDLSYNFSSKIGSAVGFISHCGAPSKREKYVAKLNRYFPVDIYGSCGNLKCGNNLRHKDSWNIIGKSSKEHLKCFEVLDTKYKFFLSFENALCFDYITEKAMHMVLEHNIVPVIRSGANHSIYFPPGSYIETKKFMNIEDLGYNLKHLSENGADYKKYFEWRRYYHTEGINRGWQDAFCNMCKRIHDDLDRHENVYRDIFEWANFHSGQTVCTSPTDL